MLAISGAMNKQVFIFLMALALSTCGQRRHGEPSMIALSKRDSSSVSSPFESLHNAGEPVWLKDGGGSVILGDMTEEKYLSVSTSRVESVGTESVFFFDITGDGVPEVWMVTDDCEADRMVLVYSLSDWSRELYRDTAGHSLFYAGNDYVLRQEAHMGYAHWYRLRWDGEKMVSEKVFDEFTGGDYTTPSEKPINEILPGDLDTEEVLKWTK